MRALTPEERAVVARLVAACRQFAEDIVRLLHAIADSTMPHAKKVEASRAAMTFAITKVSCDDLTRELFKAALAEHLERQPLDAAGEAFFKHVETEQRAAITDRLVKHMTRAT